MQVRVKKIHPAFPASISRGTIGDLSDGIFTLKNGEKYEANDLCKCFSNSCLMKDVFDKIEMHTS